MTDYEARSPNYGSKYIMTTTTGGNVNSGYNLVADELHVTEADRLLLLRTLGYPANIGSLGTLIRLAIARIEMLETAVTAPHYHVLPK